jgi:hypothetical protein
MSNFTGGSAWAMARDICAGFILVTERSLRRLGAAELDKLAFEMGRLTRELRAEQPPLDDTMKVRERNQKLVRLTRANQVLQAYRLKLRR